MIEQTNKPDGSTWRWLPFFISGFCNPLLGNLLSRWLPLHLAVALGMLVTWIVVGWVFNRVIASPNRGIAPWVASGSLAAVFAGALAFLFPWR